MATFGGHGLVQRILVVEDEPDVADAVMALLFSIPRVHVEVARDRAGGLGAVRVAPWDLVIADEGLPDGSGCDVLVEAGLHRPATRRVLLTGRADAGLTERAVNRAHVDFLVRKPWEPADLLAKVAELLEATPHAGAQRSVGRIPPSGAAAEPRNATRR